MNLRAPASIALLVFTASAAALAQSSSGPRPPAAAPSYAVIHHWVARACGVGQPADRPWALAHTIERARVQRCTGEMTERCRVTTLRAAALIEAACESNEISAMVSRRAGQPATIEAWATDAPERFTTRAGAVSVRAIIGQFPRTLVFALGADGEAKLTAVNGH